jgi:hypothetical protein
MAVQLYDRILNPIPDPTKYFIIVANYWWNKPIYNNGGNITSYSVTSFPMNLETCNITKHFEGHEEL